MQNNQNMDPNVIPPGVKKWNWGAFMFNLWWGIGNRVYIALLSIIPIVNIVMMFVLAIKGNEWAWKKNQYRDVEELRKAQDTWNRAGFVYFIVAVIAIILWVILGATAMSFLSENTSYF